MDTQRSVIHLFCSLKHFHKHYCGIVFFSGVRMSDAEEDFMLKKTFVTRQSQQEETEVCSDIVKILENSYLRVSLPDLIDP